MSSLEVNKIFASIIVAIIIFVIIGIVANYLVKINKNDGQETAYKIDIPDTPADSASSATISSLELEPISPLLVNASLKNGEKVFKKCATCHNYNKDSKSKVGPNLWNLINRPKANISGFAYSKALANDGGVWTFEDLNGFIYKPKDYIEGTKMNFAGLKNVEDRANIILWMRSNSDDPLPLP